MENVYWIKEHVDSRPLRQTSSFVNDDGRDKKNSNVDAISLFTLGKNGKGISSRYSRPTFSSPLILRHTITQEANTPPFTLLSSKLFFFFSSPSFSINRHDGSREFFPSSFYLQCTCFSLFSFSFSKPHFVVSAIVNSLISQDRTILMDVV